MVEGKMSFLFMEGKCHNRSYGINWIIAKCYATIILGYAFCEWERSKDSLVNLSKSWKYGFLGKGELQGLWKY